MPETDGLGSRLPEFEIRYFVGPGSHDYRDGIKDLLAEGR